MKSTKRYSIAELAADIVFKSTPALIELLEANKAKADKWAEVLHNPGTTDPVDAERSRKLAAGLLFEFDQIDATLRKELADRRDLDRFMGWYNANH